jgi:UDP-N-acetylmuramoylalanine--D-glutamate ligase
MCLIAAHHLTSVSLEDLSKGFGSLSSLPYRFQTIGNVKHQPIINDSKSTNVDSTLVAMRSLGKKTYLIIGGRKKLESFKPLLNFKSHIQRLYIYGESKDDIARELSELNPVECDKLLEVLLLLKQDSNQQPAPILFSPACASFDQFENFEARGLYFNEQIKKIFEVEDQCGADST